MALTDKLTSIANAIREKGGTTEKLTLDAMPTAIAALSTGGGEGGDYVPNPIVINGDCNYLFANNRFNWILENYADRLQINATDLEYAFSNAVINEDKKKVKPFYITTTSSLVDCDFMFEGSNIELPDDFFKNLNGKMKSVSSLFKNYKGTKIPSFQQATTSYYSASGLFRDANKVEEIGDLVLSPEGLGYAFNNCSRLREFPNITLNNLDRFHTYNYASNSYMFQNCCSLRSIPKDFLKEIYNTTGTSSTNGVYTAMFGNCYALDEIVGLSPRSATLTSNMLVSVIGSNYHLQRFVFDTQEDGTPYKVNWKNQTISFYNYIGWAGYNNADKQITTNYNSGITADKEVKNKDDYNRLKDDPDWWSREFIFSRFGHNAAVELINSLPDASDYLATQSGGNNSIIFYKNAGMSIDGGGVSDLTEEEIAVAAAKGWTISYTG